MKALEDLTVQYDISVRNSAGCVIQVSAVHILDGRPSQIAAPPLTHAYSPPLPTPPTMPLTHAYMSDPQSFLCLSIYLSISR